MTRAPSWIEALRDDKARATELGLRWLEPDERAATIDNWRGIWNQVPYDDVFHAENADRLERAVPLFEGPIRHRRLGKAASQMVVVHDPKDPELVWLSLSHAMPALAWATGGASVEELAQAVRAYSPTEVPGTLDLERHERVVKPMELSGIDVICRGIEAMELWMDDVTWGGAYVEDPWRSVPEDAGVMLLSANLERVREQHPGRPESFGFRTLWSKSILTVERYPYDLWVFDLRYRPASDRRVIEGLAGSEPGRRLPPDLPVDLAASLLRGGSRTPESLRMIPPEEMDPFDVACLCALAPSEATTVATLRKLVRSWAGSDRYHGLVEVLDTFGYGSMLFEAAVTVAEDTELTELLYELIAPAGEDEPADEDDGHELGGDEEVEA